MSTIYYCETCGRAGVFSEPDSARKAAEALRARCRSASQCVVRIAREAPEAHQARGGIAHAQE